MTFIRMGLLVLLFQVFSASGAVSAFHEEVKTSMIELLNSPPKLNGVKTISKLQAFKRKLEFQNCYEVFFLGNEILSENRGFYTKAIKLTRKAEEQELCTFYTGLWLRTFRGDSDLLFKGASFLENKSLYLTDEENWDSPFCVLIARDLVYSLLHVEQYDDVLDALSLFEELLVRHPEFKETMEAFIAGKYAYVNFWVQNYEGSLFWFKELLKKETIRSQSTKCGIWLDIGQCYSKLGDQDSASISYNKALDEIEGVKETRPKIYRFWKALVEKKMNEKYVLSGEFHKVIPSMEELLTIALLIDDGQQITGGLWELAELYYLQEDLMSASNYLDQLEEQLKFHYRTSIYKKSIDLRAKIALKRGEFETANNFWNKLSALKDSLGRDRGKMIALGSEVRQTLRTKEREVKQERDEKERQKENLELLLICLSVVFVIFLISFFAYRSNRKSKKQIAHQNILLEESVEQKEMLLREIHHRVKNNLQIMAGLLQMQSYAIDDDRLKEVLEKSRNRIFSISAIHQMLYRDTNIEQVDADEYFEQLMQQNAQIQEQKHDDRIETNGIQLKMDHAIPLGLILNEMVTNSYKHAFPADERGTITISLSKKNEKFLFSYSDNGIGIPKDSIPSKSKSLGLRLIEMMTRQLGGEMQQQTNPGVTYTLLF